MSTENKCIMCDSIVHLDMGYITDGKICVCSSCAESNSLKRIVTRIANMGIDSNIHNCWESPIDQTSLVNQTDGDFLPYPDNNSECDTDSYDDATPKQVEAFFTSSGPDFS